MDKENCAPCLSVVIPAYNEKATLTAVVRKVIDLAPGLLEIVIVDDCSTDGTAEIADDLARSSKQVQVVHHLKNAGKSAALKTGFALTKGDVVIVQDADLEYDPSEMWNVIEPILDGRADVVFGSRFLVRKAARVLYFSHYLANKVLTFASNLLTNLNMTDLETGYKAFRGEIIRNMIIKARSFGCEVEMVAKVAKLKCAIYEVPISYYGRTYAEGKKIGVKDGIAALWYIVHFNLLCDLASSFRSRPKLQPPATGSARRSSDAQAATL
jgi:glycosyltransferase involved in cell wall biosynthesis